MKKAIVTRYFGPGAVRGSRIQAKAEGVGSIMFDFDHASSHENRHCLAAKALAEKFGWIGLYVAGGMPDGKGNVYVSLGHEVTPSSIAGHTLDNHPLGLLGQDWFYIPEKS